jgi:hypothetical protein
LIFIKLFYFRAVGQKGVISVENSISPVYVSLLRDRQGGVFGQNVVFGVIKQGEGGVTS